MNLTSLKRLFFERGCQRIYVKRLSPNDNSKNQIYLGGSFEVLTIFPISSIESVAAGEWKKERYKAKVNFAWLHEDGQLYPAPMAQFILYPKYPEVRLSGFLVKCENPPSVLMTERLEGRLLFLGTSEQGVVLAYVSAPDSEIAAEYNSNIGNEYDQVGVFTTIDLPKVVNSKDKLLSELYRIHKLNWIESKRLDRFGKLMPCNAPNCGGYTLEAELGIRPNGYSEPDFLGWEVKQFGVSNFNRINASTITLMTPEPTSGVYKNEGVKSFMFRYGYADNKGREDRINFGGIHKTGIPNSTTKLEMQLIGYDVESGKIRNASGCIALVDSAGIEAASWSFASLLLHWNRKHNQACYVPSLASVDGVRRYSFGSKIVLGVGTDFLLFLQQLARGNIYYDPGIKMESVSTNPTVKRRSQFRIKSEYLKNLYNHNEVVDLLSING